MGKPEILVGQSNGWRNSVWEASQNNYGLCFEAMQFFHSFQSFELIWKYFVAGRSLLTPPPPSQI